MKLRDELTKVYEEAGEKTRREVDEVRGLCNKSVDRLMEDIHSVEMKVAEKQCEVKKTALQITHWVFLEIGLIF